MSNASNDLPNQSSPIMVGHHYPELDGIRGISILLILFFHCRDIATPQNLSENIYYKFAETGWVGVELFFVLSGFLITGILLDTYNQKKYFYNFYMRRILRIFPLYYAVLILLTLISQFMQIDSFYQKSTLAQLSYWFYLQNWLHLFDINTTPIISHSWSLAVEEQFYLVWPALILFAARRNAVGKLCLITIGLAFIVRAGLVNLNLPAYFLTISQMDILALGAFVVVLFRHFGSLKPLRRPAIILAVISGVTVAFVAAKERGFFGNNGMVLLIGILPLAIFFSSFLIIALTSREQGILRIFLQNRWLRFLGKISYGVYIFHWPIRILLIEIWPKAAFGFWINQLGFLVVVSVCSIAIAWFSFQYFETPILHLKKKFASI